MPSLLPHFTWCLIITFSFYLKSDSADVQLRMTTDSADSFLQRSRDGKSLSFILIISKEELDIFCDHRLSKPSFSSSGSMSQKQGKEQKNEGMWRSLKTIEQVWIWSGVTRRFINNIEPFIHYIKHYLILGRFRCLGHCYAMYSMQYTFNVINIEFVKF